MELLSYVFAALPFVTAIMVASVMLGGFAVGYKLTSPLSAAARLKLILWLIVASITLPILLNPRNLNFATEQTLLTMADFKSGFLVSRLLTLVLLGLSAVEIARGWLGGVPELRRVQWLPGAFLIYSVGTLLIQGFGSEHPDFSHKTLYLPLVMTAVYYLSHASWSDIEKQLKIALMVPVGGSLVAALLAPDFALLSPYAGLLPSIGFRLFGVTSHANVLGSSALLLLLIELYFPSSRYWRAAVILASVAAFLLAQSKIAWLAALSIVAFVWVPYRLSIYRSLPGRAQRTLRMLVGIIALVLLAAAAAVFIDWAALFDRYGFRTFTGRVAIWQTTVDDAMRNPLFGYGPSIWDFDYRRQAGMLHVGQAHNQFVQALGEAGIAGLTLLIGYLAVLLYYAVKFFAVSRGLILALFLILFFQSLTEAPLRIRALMDWPFFIHLLLFFSAAHFSSMKVAVRQKSYRVKHQPPGVLYLPRKPL